MNSGKSSAPEGARWVMSAAGRGVVALALVASFGAGLSLGHVRLTPTARPRTPVAGEAQAAAPAGSVRRSAVVDIAERVSPAVVTIGLTVRRPARSPRDPFGLFSPLLEEFWGLQGPGRARDEDVPYVGSGFIVAQSSVLGAGQRARIGNPRARYVVTNYHVVQGAREVFVTLTNGDRYAAEFLDADPVVDVALLRIDVPDGREIPTVRLGDSDDIMIGETVVALGNPFGPLIEDPHPTVTVGVVSAVDRSFQLEVDERSRSYRVYRNMIQTDASVNPGNSGGPLVNLDGEVIGINTFIISPGRGGSAGVNFAIPINRAVRVAQEILQYGEIRSIYLDFDVRELGRYRRELLLQYGIQDAQGLLVASLLETEGPAVRAGLEVGDVIVAIEGRPVTKKEDLFAQFISRTAGEKLRFTVSREGRRLEVEYEIPAGPAP